MRRYGLSPKKKLGQHFLVDRAAIGDIVDACGATAGDAVIEIGPGLGALTASLVAAGVLVTAVERDRELVRVLEDLFEDGVDVVEGDALTFDYGRCGPETPVVGNLPYNISGPVIFRLMEFHGSTGPWTLMTQREVARRLAASPGTKDYGAMTALVRPLRAVEVVREIGPGSFLPPPRVDSTVIRLEARPKPLYGDVSPAAYRRVVKAAFGTRRKTLLNAFRAFGIPNPREVIVTAGVDPGVRGETLDVDAFAALARALEL